MRARVTHRIERTIGAQEHLRIEVRHEPDRAVLALAGELDMASAPLLERAMEDEGLASTGMIVLDLQHLEFIDSTGLRIILAARRRCVEREQELAVTRGSQPVSYTHLTLPTILRV